MIARGRARGRGEMDDAELLEAMIGLAREAGLEVRRTRAGGGDEPPPASAVCRVRGSVWIVLSAADPPAVHLDVVAGALRSHAGWLIEGRYLPPAVRERVGRA